MLVHCSGASLDFLLVHTPCNGEVQGCAHPGRTSTRFIPGLRPLLDATQRPSPPLTLPCLPTFLSSAGSERLARCLRDAVQPLLA